MEASGKGGGGGAEGGAGAKRCGALNSAEPCGGTALTASEQPHCRPVKNAGANGESGFELVVCLQDVCNPVPRNQIRLMFYFHTELYNYLK